MVGYLDKRYKMKALGKQSGVVSDGGPYPRWQFTEAGALLPGIQDILQLFKSEDEWRLMGYFLGPRRQLGAQRPLDLLCQGKVKEAVAHAQLHATENTW
jgi:hypothetical protein